MRGLPVVELISVVVSCDDVQQEDVFRFRVQSGNAELHLWEHLSGIGILIELNLPLKSIDYNLGNLNEIKIIIL